MKGTLRGAFSLPEAPTSGFPGLARQGRRTYDPLVADSNATLGAQFVLLTFDIRVFYGLWRLFMIRANNLWIVSSNPSRAS